MGMFDDATYDLTAERRSMLAEIRRDWKMRKDPDPGDRRPAQTPEGDGQMIDAIIRAELARVRSAQGLGESEASSRASINRINNASTAAMAGVSELDKISAAFGRPPGWVEAQEAAAGSAPTGGPEASASAGSAAGREYRSRGIYGG